MNGSTYGLNPKMIVFLLFMGNLISGLDRFLINYGIVHISKDLQLNASSTGLILSIFFLGYAFMQIPGGWLADRFGARLVLFISIIGFSIFTGLTGLAWSLASLIAVRFIFGLAEGSFFPAGAKLISVTIPQEKRSRAMSFYLSALTVAGVAAPLLATTMLLQIGWRMMFVVIGVCGSLVGLLYWFYLKPKKEQQRQESEQPLVEQSAPPAKGAFKVLLKTPIVWSLMIASFAYGFISWGTASWMPTYLVNERGLDLQVLGVLQMIPAVTGFAFFLLAGYILDKVKSGNEKWLGAASGIGIACMVYLMFNAQTITGVVIYQSLLPMFAAVLSVIIFSLPIKQLPEAVGGSAVGMINLGMQIRDSSLRYLSAS
ncbi:MFS transporter [Bacillus aerolatus]|uniref:MFS transporter n=1 Tax=Bacillus aerolatus TaxID=2653354 RepID=A0A6I1FK45_9BACI|nr:MFS transporter [Bacillus aerolatus]KAB7709045.1 MFS transporter [Bacillus aerolatus]